MTSVLGIYRITSSPTSYFGVPAGGVLEPFFKKKISWERSLFTDEMYTLSQSDDSASIRNTEICVVLRLPKGDLPVIVFIIITAFHSLGYLNADSVD